MRSSTVASMVRLTRDRIDTAALMAAVQTPACGAVNVFLGVVRAEQLDGRTVVALEYEAYEDLAQAELARLAERLWRRWPSVHGLSLVHRLGRLAIGEASVAVVVAAGHRAESFDACRWAIDELKRMVPIWKREIFADGDSRWVLPWAGSEVLPGEVTASAMPGPSAETAGQAISADEFAGGVPVGSPAKSLKTFN